VLIPARNARHLMLRKDVVEAVRNGRFHVWAVSTIDEGLRVLTGQEPGERSDDGSYPPGTVYRLVDEKLARLAEDVRRFGAAAAAHPDPV